MPIEKRYYFYPRIFSRLSFNAAVVGLQPPHGLDDQRLLDGGDDRLNGRRLEQAGGLPVLKITSPMMRDGLSWLVTAMMMRSGRSVL